jgi:superfamily I DNA/RNA helicase
LNSSQCPAQWARGEWQQEQERNLCYVATTRAKQTLILIEEKQKERN